MPLLKKNASTSQGDHDFKVWGSLQPKLKLGRNPSLPGLLMNNLDPPAGREVQASTARYTVSPCLGMVTAIGCLRISCIFLNGVSKSSVHNIWSFPVLEAGICSSKGLVKDANFEPGRQISLNLTEPSQLLRPLTDVGGSHCARGSSLRRLGDSCPFCQ